MKMPTTFALRSRECAKVMRYVCPMKNGELVPPKIGKRAELQRRHAIKVFRKNALFLAIDRKLSVELLAVSLVAIHNNLRSAKLRRSIADSITSFLTERGVRLVYHGVELPLPTRPIRMERSRPLRKGDKPLSDTECEAIASLSKRSIKWDSKKK